MVGEARKLDVSREVKSNPGISLEYFLGKRHRQTERKFSEIPQLFILS